MSVTIYHHPKCTSSLLALDLIRAAGIEPTVIEYLQAPPTRERLKELIKALGITPRGLLRQNEKVYEKLNLADLKWTDEQIIDFMLNNPILINRPIVVTPKGTVLARPGDKVKPFLEGVSE